MRALPTLVTAAFCCFSFPGFAQQSVAPANGATALPPVADRRVTLDVVVTDKPGNPVPGLQREDFTVLDDKQPKTILAFRAGDENSKAVDPPPQAILLVDAVNASFQSVSYARQELEKFLRQDGGRLPVPMSLILLADTSTQVQPNATRDGNSLADSLNSNQYGLRTIRRSQGFYGGVDRAQISLRALEQLASYEKTQPGRKLLIWLSPGWPLLSGPRVQLTTKDQQALFNTVVTLSTELREARITLYSIDPLGTADAGTMRTFLYESFVKGVSSAKRVENGNLGLQVLATQSGGRVLNSSNDIASSVARCVADAKAFYTLSFDSALADNPNEYHSLQVKIGKPGLSAHTRTGYYAQPQKPRNE